MTYQDKTGSLMANSHPGSYCGQDAYSDLFVVEGGERMDNRKRTGEHAESSECSGMSELYARPTDSPNGNKQVEYVVRRLTPTECARLQGFPDAWGIPDSKDELTDDEYTFWLDVRNTQEKINGRQPKNYTNKQILTWYNKLHTDSAEYKMWGNGIALPNAMYVMQGIKSLFGGERDNAINSHM